MTTTFAVNEDNDLFIGKDGKLAVATGIDAVMFACASAAKAQLNEMIYAYDSGVANFETMWRNSANVAAFEASVRAAISAVEGVAGIQEFTVTVQNGVCSYAATIETIYGVVTL